MPNVPSLHNVSLPRPGPNQPVGLIDKSPFKLLGIRTRDQTILLVASSFPPAVIGEQNDSSGSGSERPMTSSLRSEPTKAFLQFIDKSSPEEAAWKCGAGKTPRQDGKDIRPSATFERLSVMTEEALIYKPRTWL